MSWKSWNLKHGSWWMVQWQWSGWLSFGVHLDFRKRYIEAKNVYYGPYVDFHLGCVIVSLGRNPVYSGNLDSDVSVSRGGVRDSTN